MIFLKLFSHPIGLNLIGFLCLYMGYDILHSSPYHALVYFIIGMFSFIFAIYYQFRHKLLLKAKQDD